MTAIIVMMIMMVVGIWPQYEPNIRRLHQCLSTSEVSNETAGGKKTDMETAARSTEDSVTRSYADRHCHLMHLHVARL
jgi:hypothetical protein